VLQRADGWARSDLKRLDAEHMDVERILHLIANIDASMNAIHSVCDSRKLLELKAFFELELRRRGQRPAS